MSAPAATTAARRGSQLRGARPRRSCCSRPRAVSGGRRRGRRGGPVAAEGARLLEDARLRAPTRACAATVRRRSPSTRRRSRSTPRHEDALYYLGQCRRDLGRPADGARGVRATGRGEPGQRARPPRARARCSRRPTPRSRWTCRPPRRTCAERTRSTARRRGRSCASARSCSSPVAPTRRVSSFEAALRTNPRSVEAAFLRPRGVSAAGACGPRLAARVREAARIEAPGQGGAERGRPQGGREQRVAAPPLKSPLGRLLFAAPVSRPARPRRRRRAPQRRGAGGTLARGGGASRRPGRSRRAPRTPLVAEQLTRAPAATKPGESGLLSVARAARTVAGSPRLRERRRRGIASGEDRLLHRPVDADLRVVPGEA